MATTSNPVLSRANYTGVVRPDAGSMTLGGTITKTFVLLGILATATAVTWARIGDGAGLPDNIGMLFLVAVLAGFGMAVYTVYRPEHAPVTAPIYAALEGVLLGAISALINARYRGLPVQAVVLTIATLALMLVAYRTGVIRATERLKTIVVSCTASIAVFYLIAMGLGLFGIQIPFLHEGGLIGIGFSLFVTGLAAFNLILDFDQIERGVGQAPAYMEWYGAFGLIVTLVWLYLEILQLLRKLRR